MQIYEFIVKIFSFDVGLKILIIKCWGEFILVAGWRRDWRSQRQTSWRPKRSAGGYRSDPGEGGRVERVGGTSGLGSEYSLEGEPWGFGSRMTAGGEKRGWCQALWPEQLETCSYPYETPARLLRFMLWFQRGPDGTVKQANLPLCCPFQRTFLVSPGLSHPVCPLPAWLTHVAHCTLPSKPWCCYEVETALNLEPEDHDPLPQCIPWLLNLSFPLIK